MQRDLEQKLRQIRLLRRIREAEQFRLAGELKASQRRLSDSSEAGEEAGRYLEGELQFGGLLARHGLQVAVQSVLEIAEEQRVFAALSERNISTRTATDTLADTERRLWGHLDAYLSNNALLDAITSRPRARDDEDD
ncbi:MAG: hypothetical protein LJE67_13720 [Salaquimonas sp.]|jgi:hypothetical protein|nr:hypothetical protein [Salaquimonas sp.]